MNLRDLFSPVTILLVLSLFSSPLAESYAQPFDIFDTLKKKIEEAAKKIEFPEIPAPGPGEYDWNQEDRDMCKTGRSWFYTVACPVAAAACSKRFKAVSEVCKPVLPICFGIGVVRYNECNTDYPRDIHKVPPLPVGPQPCDVQYRFGCARGL